MRKTLYSLFFILITCSFTYGQRENRDLPLFDPEPYFIVNDSIRGWSLSTDGQWLSEKMIIPVIGISRNTKYYEEKNNYLGIDNIKSLQAYRVQYGSKQMLCLVKIFRTGFFKYPNRKKGWEEQNDLYYWIVKQEDLAAALNYYQKNDTGQTFSLKVRAYDSKAISDIDKDEIIDEIRAQAIIKPNYQKDLVITLRSASQAERIQFHLSAKHVVFDDVEGVREDFRRKGRSLYGSSKLFDYLYFEMKRAHFFDLLHGGQSIDEWSDEEAPKNSMKEDAWEEDEVIEFENR